MMHCFYILCSLELNQLVLYCFCFRFEHFSRRQSTGNNFYKVDKEGDYAFL